MDTKTIRLMGADGNLVAVARVTDEGKHWGGKIDLTATPAAVRALFDEFEECVNGQMFTFADEVEAKIDALKIRAALEDGTTAAVTDLQVFPEFGDVSFKLARAEAVNGVAKPARESHRSQ